MAKYKDSHTKLIATVFVVSILMGLGFAAAYETIVQLLP